MVSIRSAVRIKETVGQLKLNVKKVYLVINKYHDGIGNIERLEEVVKENGLELLCRIPLDEEITRAGRTETACCLPGKPLR